MPPAVDEDYVRALREKVKNSKKRKAAAAAATTAQPGDELPSARAGKAAKTAGEPSVAGSNDSEASAATSSTQATTNAEPITTTPAPPPSPPADVEMTTGGDDRDDDREEGEISDDDGPPPPSPPTTVQSPAPLPPPPPLQPPPPHQMPLSMAAYEAHMAAMMREALVGAQRFPPMSAQLREALEGKAPAPPAKKEEEKSVDVKPVVKDYDPVAIGTAALKIDEQEYRATRILLLELISWGVAPEYFVSPLGLSREAILLYFRDLRIRLPANLPKGPARNRKAKPDYELATSNTIREEPEAGELEEEEEGEVAEDDEVVLVSDGPAAGAPPALAANEDGDSASKVQTAGDEAAALASESQQPPRSKRARKKKTQSNPTPVAGGQRELPANGPPPQPAAGTSPQPFLSPQAAFQQQVALAAAYPQMYPPAFYAAQPYFDSSMAYYAGLNQVNMGYLPTLQQQQQSQQFLQAWSPSIQQPKPNDVPPPQPQASPPPPPNSPPPALPPLPPPSLSPNPESRVPVTAAAANSSTSVADASPPVTYTTSSTRLVRKLPAKRPSALDLDQPATASMLSPASDQAAAYVPFFNFDRVVRQLVADQPRRLVIDISDDEGDSDDDFDDTQQPADNRMQLGVHVPTVRAKSATPSVDSLQAIQAKESEIQLMRSKIAAMEKRQKARSPSAQPPSQATSPRLSTTATPLPEPTTFSSSSSASSLSVSTPSVLIAPVADGLGA